jgi:hypothetical protein
MRTRYSPPAGSLRTGHAKRLCDAAMTERKSLLRTLVELMGGESAQKMVAELGGARVWVPVRSTPDSRLTRIVGEPAASALCSRFGGDYLQVPNTMTPDNVHQRIAELHRQGLKINDIALTVGCSRRTVFRLLRRKITELRSPHGLIANRNRIS